MASHAPRKGKEKQPQPMQQDESGDEDKDEEGATLEGEPGSIWVGDICIPPPPPAICSSDNDGPRLIITHIVNENFKSYAGNQSLGPFHKSFTAIVGPNGSGKSNVIDSMLFVFGYRASKIRSKKISVLLHKSERFTNIRSCTVAVHFEKIIDKGDGTFDRVPNTKFAVARTAFADSSSFYTINGKRATFKEVAVLLRSQGIDLVHNRFLILQGEVEQIAMMKPKAQTEHDTGMLEYLEDIIGTSRFKEPIRKIAERVEELTTERVEKLNRLRLVEKEKDGLQGPRDEAISWLEAWNDLIRSKNSLLRKGIHNLQKEIAVSDKRKAEIDEGMSELKANMSSVKATRKDLCNTIQTNAEAIKKMRAENEKRNEMLKEAGKQHDAQCEEATQLNVRRKQIREMKKQEESKLAELVKVPEKNRVEIEKLAEHEEKLVQQLAKEKIEYDNVMKRMEENCRPLTIRKEGLQTELIGLKETVEETKKKYLLAESELELFLRNEQTAIAKLAQLREQLQAAESTIVAHKVTQKELQARIPAAQSELEAVEAELNMVQRDEVRIAEEWGKAVCSVEEVRSSMQANRSRGRVIDFLMRLKVEGKLPGILARLGDLGAIDQRYDIAISTACGQLDNIVTEDLGTARDGIEQLRNNNVGRATFIVLEKQQHLLDKCRAPFHAPEDVPRLFDLIRVSDDRVRPAFYFAIRDTLVSKDLDQAGRIAYGSSVRYRVVTLKGEIIEPSGTMSGGGRSVMKGRMGQAVAVNTNAMTPGQLETLERRASQLEKRLADLRARQLVLEETANRLRGELKKCRTQLDMCTIELNALASSTPELRSQVKAQEAVVTAAAPSPEQQKQMNKAVNKAKKDYDTAMEGSSGLEAEVAKVTAEIKELTSSRVKKVEEKVADVTKKLTKTRTQATKLKVAIKTAERHAAQSTERIASYQSEIEDIQQTIVKLQKVIEEMGNKGTEQLKEAQDSEEALMAKEESLKKMNKELQKIEAKELELKAAKMKEDQRIKDLEELIKDKKTVDLPQLERHLNKLALEAVPHHEVEPLKELSEDELAAVDCDRLKPYIVEKEAKLAKEKPALRVIQEFDRAEALYNERKHDLEEITEKRNKMRDWYDDVRRRRLNEFIEGFTIITDKLRETYQMITLGGDAELELVDSLDPFSEGIVFSVRPPKKSWKNISNLSGGEKTLSSLALVFALHYYKPTPLYVMDEIDAALDTKNVAIVANYVKERTKNAQFIIISLRSNMFELGDRLIGIYKTENCTKSVTINPVSYEQLTVPRPLELSQQVPASGKTTKQRGAEPPPASQKKDLGKRKRPYPSSSSSGSGASQLDTNHPPGPVLVVEASSVLSQLDTNLLPGSQPMDD